VADHQVQKPHIGHPTHGHNRDANQRSQPPIPSGTVCRDLGGIHRRILAHFENPSTAAEEALAGTGRVVIRYGGTEALARVMIEAEDHAAMTHHAEAIANAIRVELGV
jgi:phosphomannomutase